MKDFELFQKEFKKWQKLFGLTGYKVYFKYEPDKEYFAGLTVDQTNMVATAKLNSKLPDKDEPHKDIRQSAKHEALHLLVSRLEKNGRYRYISDNEIYEATEELVVRLEGLIP
jgi:23S rRNA G2069 N7-methylase RlmK/C1962 C5-methylase RlmI